MAATFMPRPHEVWPVKYRNRYNRTFQLEKSIRERMNVAVSMKSLMRLTNRWDAVGRVLKKCDKTGLLCMRGVLTENERDRHLQEFLFTT